MLGAVVNPVELSLMCQAVSVSRRRPGAPSFAYSECLRDDQSQCAYLVNALDVLLFPWRLWENLEEQDCCPSTLFCWGWCMQYCMFCSKVVLSQDKLHITVVHWSQILYPDRARMYLQGFLQ